MTHKNAKKQITTTICKDTVFTLLSTLEVDHAVTLLLKEKLLTSIIYLRDKNCPRLKSRLLAYVALYIGVFFTIVNSSAAYSQSEFVPELQPSPAYQPSEVVGIQMRALANNDKPFSNAGIEITFRFASPKNKLSTGPIERFTGLFNHPAYRAMINHSSLEVGKAEVRQNRARVPVKIETDDGRNLIFLFELSLQNTEPYLNCWMTDAVTPVDISNSDKPVVL